MKEKYQQANLASPTSIANSSAAFAIGLDNGFNNNFTANPNIHRFIKGAGIRTPDGSNSPVKNVTKTSKRRTVPTDPTADASARLITHEANLMYKA
mmetsp:Transcript_10294/g.15437  ORF Transcript_10294/g.15437 Transcript_10294/m.15437 type:complete len:96 (-) Transcript_10294:321-608(-)